MKQPNFVAMFPVVAKAIEQMIAEQGDKFSLEKVNLAELECRTGIPLHWRTFSLTIVFDIFLFSSLCTDSVQEPRTNPISSVPLHTSHQVSLNPL